MGTDFRTARVRGVELTVYSWTTLEYELWYELRQGSVVVRSMLEVFQSAISKEYPS